MILYSEIKIKMTKIHLENFALALKYCFRFDLNILKLI